MNLFMHPCPENYYDFYFVFHRFGFSFVHGSSRDSREHPANQEIVVLAIIGGVSWKEVAQIQSIIADNPSCNKKIVVLSNSIINAEDMLRMMFRR